MKIIDKNIVMDRLLLATNNLANKINKYYILSTLKNNMNIFNKKYGVVNIGLFGSYILDRQRKNSDIDILVEFKYYDYDKYEALLGYLESLFPEFVIQLTEVGNIMDEYRNNILGTVVYAKGDIKKQLTEVSKKIKEDPAMGEKDHGIYLNQMRDKSLEIIESMKNVKNFEDFNNDINLKKAVRSDLIDIGNIAKNLMNFDALYGTTILIKEYNLNKGKNEIYYKDINLTEIYDHRNVIDHGYDKIDYGKVYKIAAIGIPELEKRVSKAVEDLSKKEQIQNKPGSPKPDSFTKNPENKPEVKKKFGR